MEDVEIVLDSDGYKADLERVRNDPDAPLPLILTCGRCHDTFVVHLPVLTSHDPSISGHHGARPGPVRKKSAKPLLNDPCPCRSGKRYRKCCRRK